MKHRQGCVLASCGRAWHGMAWSSPAALGDLNTWGDALEEFDDIVGSWDS